METEILTSFEHHTQTLIIFIFNKRNLAVHNHECLWWFRSLYWFYYYLIRLFNSIFWFVYRIMRRREIQSFTLKLSDLKEYEAVRQERLEAKAQQNKAEESMSPERSPMKIYLPKWGPKSKQEVRERIGLKTERN